jgi:hypothetical protein
MFAVIVLLLTLLVLATGLVFMVMFLDVALHPAHAYVGAGNLPLLEGRSLQRWAARWAEAKAKQHLAQKPSAAAVVELAADVESSLSDLLEWARVEPHEYQEPALCERGESAIRVTAPEVFVIADNLRRTKSKQVLSGIEERAREGAIHAPESPCPLLDAEGHCETFASRPLFCRSHCPACEAAGEPTTVASNDPFALAVGEGVTQGLVRGLTSAGLDHQVYDLSSALAVALETPNVTERWAHGEPVLAGCKTA